MICWEIEKIFDGKINFGVEKADIYSMLRSHEEHSPLILDKIIKECKKSEKKHVIRCVIGFLLNKNNFEEDEEYYNLDFDMNDILGEICNNEEILCDLLLDYCYKYKGNKEILWNVCGETLLNRLSKNHTLHYPIVDINGDFEVQGKKYSMKQYVPGGDEDEI